MVILTIKPGDTVRIKLPEYKGKHFHVITVFYDLIEIEIGKFIERNLVQKKYRNRYLTIPS